MATGSSGLPKILTMPSKPPGTPAPPTVLPAPSTASGIATGKNEIDKNRRTLNFTVVKLKSFISNYLFKKTKNKNKQSFGVRKIRDLFLFLCFLASCTNCQRMFTSKKLLFITVLYISSLTLNFKFDFFFNLSGSSFNLDDNQKRWMVIGICLNKILLPPLRDFVAKEISKHYIALKNAHKIDTQVKKKNALSKDGLFMFNYGSINGNWKRKKAFYTYKVSSAEELARLYLEPKMAKFTGKKIRQYKIRNEVA